LAVGGLLGIGIWSLSSAAWSESVEGAITAGNRWLVYGALLLLMVGLVRGERRAALLLGAGTAGVCVVALSVLLRLLGHDPGTLFLGGRLNAPLGYINGEGCLFGMGFWLCMAGAEARRAWIAGPAAAAATLMACLALLTQSRGTALAMIAVSIGLVALVPGRVRRCYALVTVALGTALATPALLHVYSSVVAGLVPASVAHAAGRSALVASLGVGVVWSLLSGGWELIRARPTAIVPARRLSRIALVTAALAGLALAASAAHPIAREVGAQWSAFVHLAPSESASSPSTATSRARIAAPVRPAGSDRGRTRLLLGAGNRYDYWRIAWRLWSEHPIFGIGGDDYTRFYYQRRATTEDIDQPHSLELQLLAELGWIGALLLASFLGAVGWAAVRMRRHAQVSATTRALLVAAAGAFGVWLGQASVDWMHLLPGLTALALAAVAVLLWPRGAPVESASAERAGGPRLSGARLPIPVRAPGLLTAVAVATLIVAGGTLSRQGLSQIYAKRAAGELYADPASAAQDADRALAIDADAVDTYYVKAAAQARFDRAAAAQATLRQALAREPRNFVTWALLGDISMREHRFALARSYYLRALSLNPLNPTLRELALDPRGALRQ
jgi:hypothetical protein